MVSYIITGHLVAALRVQEEFSTSDHAAFLSEWREGVQKWNSRRLEEALTETFLGALSNMNATCIR